MAKATSNVTEMAGRFAVIRDALNLRGATKPGNRRLGDELIDAGAAAIRERTVGRQVDPTGAPLKPLSRSYLLSKIRHGYSSRIGVRTGEMTEPEQIRGHTSVTTNVAETSPGLDSETRAKVSHFTAGGRPWYALGKDGEAAVSAVVNEALGAAVGKAQA